MRFPAIAINSDLFKSLFARFTHALKQLQLTNASVHPWRSSLLMVILTFGLTGCLDAQTNIEFNSPHRGQIVQHIQLGSQLTAAQGWLNQIEAQARKLDGRVARPSRQELTVTLPFTNARDLESKFNQLLSSPQSTATNLKHSQSSANGEIPEVNAQLQVKTSNLLLLQRNKLIYDIDLTSLGLQSEDGDVLLNAGSGLDLNFSISGPWGAGGAAVQKQSGQAVWTLNPGQKNHIEAALWMPSPIGLGTVVIVGLVAAGTYYNRKQTA